MEPKTEQKTAYLKNLSSFYNRKTGFETDVAKFQNAYQARKWLNFKEKFLFFNALFEAGIDLRILLIFFWAPKSAKK